MTAVKNIYLRGGATAEHSGFTGLTREVTVDTDKKVLVVHDGKTEGGFPTAKASLTPTVLSHLTEDAGLWLKTALTKVSHLTNDVGYWTDLTKVSQLTNDSGFKTGHCSYCSHCTYCSQCSRCNNVQCGQVQCSQVHCTQCSGYCTSLCAKCTTACSNCDCSRDCDCGDDA